MFGEEQGQGAKIRGMYMATKCEVVDEQDKQTGPHNALKVRGWDTQVLSYKDLFAHFKKGQRNGNWRELNRLDKALYRASLWYTKHLKCEADLFAWAPQLKVWLKDPDYIFWLGTMR